MSMELAFRGSWTRDVCKIQTGNSTEAEEKMSAVSGESNSPTVRDMVKEERSLAGCQHV